MADYIPETEENLYVLLDNGFELFNVMQIAQLQKSDDTKLVDSGFHVKSLSWAKSEC